MHEHQNLVIESYPDGRSVLHHSKGAVTIQSHEFFIIDSKLLFLFFLHFCQPGVCAHIL